MQVRRNLTILAVALAAASCSDQPAPTAVTSDAAGAMPEAQFVRGPAATTDLLTDIPITETLPGGEVFTGLLTITELNLVDGALVASGTLTGDVTDALGNLLGTVNVTFTDIVAALLTSGSGACDILFLELGPIDLNLLGLQLDVSQITIDLTAQTGPGKLLGNLLCAVAHLLDGPGAIAGLLNLLDQINSILG
jgi:hypothetical protein